MSASPRSINGANVYFTPPQTGANRIHNLTGAANGDPVCVYGNLAHYGVAEAGRPTVSRRPATGFEEMATRFRMHFNAAGNRINDSAFVMADSA